MMTFFAIYKKRTLFADFRISRKAKFVRKKCEDKIIRRKVSEGNIIETNFVNFVKAGLSTSLPFDFLLSIFWHTDLICDLFFRQDSAIRNELAGAEKNDAEDDNDSPTPLVFLELR